MTTNLALKEHYSPRPIYESAQIYYNDFNSEKRQKTFTMKSHDFNYICKANEPNTPITRKEQDLLATICNMIDRSKSGKIALTPEKLSSLTGNQKRQNNVIRKHLSHILHSKYRKGVKIDGVIKRKVIVFQYNTNGKDRLNNPHKYYNNVKTSLRPPTSIYKDENKVIKKRSTRELNFSDNSNLNNTTETVEIVEIPKSVIKKKVLGNIRKKSTASEIKTNRKAKLYNVNFNQYAQTQNIAYHYPLNEQDCSTLQSKSGRDFNLNAMNEILFNMSRKSDLQDRKFYSKAQFLAYFAECLIYEKRQAVQCQSENFYIKANKTKAEIAERTTQDDRDKYLANVEQNAIIHRSDEAQYRAKLANRLKPSQAYDFLSNLKAVRKVGEVFEVIMQKTVELSDYSLKMILQEAQAVGGFAGVEELEIVV